MPTHRCGSRRLEHRSQQCSPREADSRSDRPAWRTDAEPHGAPHPGGGEPLQDAEHGGPAFGGRGDAGPLNLAERGRLEFGSAMRLPRQREIYEPVRGGGLQPGSDVEPNGAGCPRAAGWDAGRRSGDSLEPRRQDSRSCGSSRLRPPMRHAANSTRAGRRATVYTVWC
jgi:hypothetical protein